MFIYIDIVIDIPIISLRLRAPDLSYTYDDSLYALAAWHKRDTRMTHT